LKPERWGSLLVQEKYREEQACDKRHPYSTIIIIIIIINIYNYSLRNDPEEQILMIDFVNTLVSTKYGDVLD
jgi:hypothetical protein